MIPKARELDAIDMILVCIVVLFYIVAHNKDMYICTYLSIFNIDILMYHVRMQHVLSWFPKR